MSEIKNVKILSTCMVMPVFARLELNGISLQGMYYLDFANETAYDNNGILNNEVGESLIEFIKSEKKGLPVPEMPIELIFDTQQKMEQALKEKRKNV